MIPWIRPAPDGAEPPPAGPMSPARPESGPHDRPRHRPCITSPSRLKKAIRHASHERTTSDNLVVRVTLDDGQVGYGEGVPRSYVTGETIETAFAMLSTLDVARRDRHDPATSPRSSAALEALSLPETEADPRGMAGNAARCALELAMLDAYGRRFGESLGRAIRLVDVPGLAAP